MKSFLFNLIFISSSLLLHGQAPFITTWKTDNPGSSCSSCINIPTFGSGYNYDVDWDNDGVYDELGITGDITHDYGVSGNYTIRIKGNFPRIHFNNIGDKLKLISIDQWGSNVWTSFENSFYGCQNLIYNANDTPNLNSVTSMRAMFQNCILFNGDLSSWNTSNVLVMGSLFEGCTNFNGNIATWNILNVNSMEYMFSNCTSFNQPLSAWNPMNVQYIHSMFDGASSFNQPINSWNVQNVLGFNNMFDGASSFNQPLNSWITANANNMQGMFNNAVSFNQDISGWNTAAVTNMQSLFRDAVSFNQDLSMWNVDEVTDFGFFLYNASNFNQDLKNWSLKDAAILTNMLSLSGIDCINYSETLIGWSNNINTPNNLSLGALGRQYGTNAVSARMNLISKGWTIAGDSQLDETCSNELVLEVNIVNHATCLQNGMLEFQLQNAPDSSIIVYLVLNDSQDTLGVIQDTNFVIMDTLGGRIPGIYNVVCILNDADTFSMQKEILNYYENIVFTTLTQNEFCGNDGMITVNLISGNNVLYSLLEGDETIRPYQQSNIFSNLPEGNYTLSLIDTCENVAIGAATIVNKETAFTIVEGGTNTPVGLACDSINVHHSIYSIPNGELQYPLTFNYYIYNPSSNDTILLSREFTNGGTSSLIHQQMTIPYYSGTPYLMDLKITDKCNDTITYNQDISSSFTSGVYQLPNGCNWDMHIWHGISHPPVSIEFITAPFNDHTQAPFDPLMYNSTYPPIFDVITPVVFSNDTMSMPTGYYEIQVIGSCNDTFMITGNFSDPGLNIPIPVITPDCIEDKGIIQFSSNFDLQSVNIINNNDTISLNHGIDINNLKSFYASDIDVGLYDLIVTDVCGNSQSLEIDIPSREGELDSFRIDAYCGSFNYYFNYVHNDEIMPYYPGPFYYLQYKENDVWKQMNSTPYTTPTVWPFINGQEINNNLLNINVTREGEFRILRLLMRPSQGSTGEFKVCEDVIHDFIHINDGFKFDSLYSFECTDSELGISNYKIFCHASGVEPLSYDILKINGQDTLIENGNDSLFNSVAAGLYEIRVKDACNNQLFREIELTDISNPIIFADSICDGLAGRLYTDDLPFIEYEWRKTGNAQILSSTNELKFEPFGIEDSGTYELTLIYPGSSSCVNQILEYTIPSVIPNNQTAGNDLDWTICDSLETINLNQYLSLNANSGGIWLNQNGSQINDPTTYSISLLNSGNNYLSYFIDVLCGVDDVAIINFVKDSCNNPCIEISGKLKLSTPIDGQPGFKIMVFNPDMTVGIVDLNVLFDESSLVNDLGQNDSLESRINKLEEKIKHLNSELESSIVEIKKLKKLSLKE
ncbi:MAG: DUF285 domain-containing protein [Saprospiraceae bacterium]|nr:DUF285 domain-containing protein [Saprospiraceae bacterium]